MRRNETFYFAVDAPSIVARPETKKGTKEKEPKKNKKTADHPNSITALPYSYTGEVLKFGR